MVDGAAITLELIIVNYSSYLRNKESTVPPSTAIAVIIFFKDFFFPSDS